MEVGSVRLMVLVIMKKAVLLLEKRTFKELLVDMELRNLQNNIVGQEASRLFARAEINMGVEALGTHYIHC